MDEPNQLQIEANELGEDFTAEVTEEGVHLNHNWDDGGLFIPHDQWEGIEEFRTNVLAEQEG